MDSTCRDDLVVVEETSVIWSSSSSSSHAVEAAVSWPMSSSVPDLPNVVVDVGGGTVSFCVVRFVDAMH